MRANRACTLSEIKSQPGRGEIYPARDPIGARAISGACGLGNLRYTPDTSGTVFFSFGEVTLNITYLLPKYIVPVCMPTAAEMQRMLLIVGSEDWAWTATCTQ